MDLRLFVKFIPALCIRSAWHAWLRVINIALQAPLKVQQCALFQRPHLPPLTCQTISNELQGWIRLNHSKLLLPYDNVTWSWAGRRCRTLGWAALLMEENIAPPELPLHRAGAQSILHAYQTPACSCRGELWTTASRRWAQCCSPAWCWKKETWLLCHLNPPWAQCWKSSAVISSMQIQKEQQSEILLSVGNPLTLKQLNIPFQMADFFFPVLFFGANWCFLKYWH